MSTTTPCGRLRFRDPLPGGALAVMRDALPATYDRGMERMTVPLDPARDDGTIPVRKYDFAGYERFYGKPPASPAICSPHGRTSPNPSLSGSPSPGKPARARNTWTYGSRRATRPDAP